MEENPVSTQTIRHIFRSSSDILKFSSISYDYLFFIWMSSEVLQKTITLSGTQSQFIIMHRSACVYNYTNYSTEMASSPEVMLGHPNTPALEIHGVKIITSKGLVILIHTNNCLIKKQLQTQISLTLLKVVRISRISTFINILFFITNVLRRIAICKKILSVHNPRSSDMESVKKRKQVCHNI